MRMLNTKLLKLILLTGAISQYEYFVNSHVRHAEQSLNSSHKFVDSYKSVCLTNWTVLKNLSSTNF